MSTSAETYAELAEVAIQRALDRGLPMTPRSLHQIMTTDLDLYTAQVRAFETEQGIKALRNQAVAAALKSYGVAVDTGRDAVHVRALDRESAARRVAMLEGMRAQLNRSCESARNELALLSLDDDVAVAPEGQQVGVDA